MSENKLVPIREFDAYKGKEVFWKSGREFEKGYIHALHDMGHTVDFHIVNEHGDTIGSRYLDQLYVRE